MDIPAFQRENHPAASFDLHGSDSMSRFFAALKKFAVAEEGATMVEYGVMVALITAVVVATVVAIGQKTSNAFVTTNTALGTAGL